MLRNKLKKQWDSLKRRTSIDERVSHSIGPTSRLVKDETEPVVSSTEPVVSSQDSGSQTVDGGLEPQTRSEATATIEPDRLENSSNYTSTMEMVTEVVEALEHSSVHSATTSSEEASLRPDGSQSPVFSSPTASEILWNRAYALTRESDRMTVSLYEYILSQSMDGAASPYESLRYHTINTDPEARQARMEDLLAIWLREPDASEGSKDTEELAEGDTNEFDVALSESHINDVANSDNSDIKSIRRIIRQAVEDSLPGAAVGWVGACHASKVRHLSYNSYRHLMNF